jgi:Flp pilus assembly protein TadD
MVSRLGHQGRNVWSRIVYAGGTVVVGAALVAGCASTKKPIELTNEGIMLQQKGDLDGAILKYREALKLDPKDDQAHLGLGSALQKKGDPSGAIAEYQQALAAKPDLAGAHMGLGYCLYAKGDRAGAIRELKAYLQNPPSGEEETRQKVEQDVKKLEAAR